MAAFATAADQDSPRVGAGIRLGGNTTGWFQGVADRNSTADESGPFTFGPAIDVRLSDLVGIEAGALFTGVDRRSSGGYGSLSHFSEQETGSMWTFPVLGKVRVPARCAGFRPFVVAGPVFYRLRTTERYHRGYVGLGPDGRQTWIESSGTTQFSDSEAGVALGGGLERFVRRARLSVEGRLSFWPSQKFYWDDVRRRQSPQFAILAGFGF